MSDNAKRYRSRRPFERKGEVGTGAPPPSPTEGWAIVERVVRATGTWVTLNVAGVVVVKRGDRYCCTVRKCINDRRTPLHVGDDSYAGCLHTRFVRDAERGVHVPTGDLPPPTDADCTIGADDERSDDELPTLDDDVEHIPPF